jgi:phenylalanyl-tRNA synthetase beta chain
MRTSQILNCIEDADTSRIVQDVDVFDIYEDNPDVPEGKKSVAFHIIYRSDSRTLTDTEVEKVEQNIKKVLEQDLGAEIR